MKCPHCNTAIHAGWNGPNMIVQLPTTGGVWHLRHQICPECNDFIAELMLMTPDGQHTEITALVWPRNAARPVGPEVEARYAQDFKQAAAILSISPKASAAVSRRLVQDVIREKAGIEKKTLDAEITELIDSGQLPSWLASNLDSIRAVGNFAAHPIKSTNTGEVVDVEAGEAEFLLDVLDDLFYFVQPEKAKQHLSAINAKLQDAGKPASRPLRSRLGAGSNLRRALRRLPGDAETRQVAVSPSIRKATVTRHVVGQLASGRTTGGSFKSREAP